MLDVEGFILVGGKSSRMGTDKSRLMLEGKTAVERIADEMRSATSSVRVVGADAGAAGIIADIHAEWGPLGGIQAALTASKHDWCLIVACDLPFVTCELFERLIQLSDESAEAIVPLQDDSRPQPLCAIYRRQPCLLAAERAIDNGEHSPRALLDKVKTRYLSFEQLSNLAGAEHFFFNVNTPESYERAKQIARLLSES
jgi:molybdopterin-guanine dinucleotide biosynthesis protein A